MTTTRSEQYLLEVARSAGRDKSEARQRNRERALYAREHGLGADPDDRNQIIERLMAVAGIRQEEIDEMRKRGVERVRARREEVTRLVTSADDRRQSAPALGSRGSPLPFAPDLYKLVLLDTATFLGPPREDPGPNSLALVVPDPPAPNSNFVRAFVEIDSHHQQGFDPGHLNFAVAEAFFVFTADDAIQMNAGGYVDWTGQDILLASWYPFDDCRGEAILTLGMEVFVVSPDGMLINSFNAAPDQGFDDSVDVGLFDFPGADLENTYSSNSAFFLTGIPVDAGNRVFFRVFGELTAFSKSEATTIVDLFSGDNGISFPLVWAATFSR
ncbi:MAG: hypothetical protein ACXV7F_06560 [Methylomonas sp.]